MTYKQFKHWESFAVRMAKHCYPEATEKRRAKILEEIKSFFNERKYQKDYSAFTDWDGNGDEEDISSYVEDFFEEYTHWNRREAFWTGKFHNQVTSCIRSGFDIAVKQSGGVLGFTVGDIRRMWKKVPDWVKDGWNISFDEMMDSDLIWL